MEKRNRHITGMFMSFVLYCISVAKIGKQFYKTDGKADTFE